MKKIFLLLKNYDLIILMNSVEPYRIKSQIFFMFLNKYLIKENDWQMDPQISNDRR